MGPERTMQKAVRGVKVNNICYRMQRTANNRKYKASNSGVAFYTRVEDSEIQTLTVGHIQGIFKIKPYKDASDDMDQWMIKCYWYTTRSDAEGKGHIPINFA